MSVHFCHYFDYKEATSLLIGKSIVSLRGMTIATRLSLLLTILILQGCKQTNTLTDFEADKTFPEVSALENFPGTVFSPCLESSSIADKNTIYAASLMMCWNEIKTTLNDSLSEFTSPELEWMNNTTTHQNALKPDEYISEAVVDGPTIIARAYFKKSLPFVRPMQKLNSGMTFKGQPVSAFGFDGSHPGVTIYYYNSDNDFALRIRTSDQDHEIILVKTSFTPKASLKTYIDEVYNARDAFLEKRNNTNFRNYYLEDEDETRIPMMAFNLETSFPELVGSTFKTTQTLMLITKAYQRTAFVLNEKGAEVESEAEMNATEAEEPEPAKPKQLFFDKDFLVLLKRKEVINPYFAMYVTNTELMVQQ